MQRSSRVPVHSTLRERDGPFPLQIEQLEGSLGASVPIVAGEDRDARRELLEVNAIVAVRVEAAEELREETLQPRVFARGEPRSGQSRGRRQLREDLGELLLGDPPVVIGRPRDALKQLIHAEIAESEHLPRLFEVEIVGVVVVVEGGRRSPPVPPRRGSRIPIQDE